MKVTAQQNIKIDDSYKDKEKLIFKDKKVPKIIKNIIIILKTREKISMANKFFKKGIISETEFCDYKKKILKEKELSIKGELSKEEIIFEIGEYCLKSVFKDNEIVYRINQFGMEVEYYDLDTAIENFIILTM